MACAAEAVKRSHESICFMMTPSQVQFNVKATMESITHPVRTRSHRGNIPKLPQTKCCSFCPAKFTRTTHLNRHVRSHINQRLYHCNMCNSQFTRSDLLSRHKKTCGNSSNPHRSRQKSCQACAESKIKCDLLYPCSKCISRGRECIFFNDPEVSRMKKSIMKSVGGSLTAIPLTSDLDFNQSRPVTPTSYHPHRSSLEIHENSDNDLLPFEQRSLSTYTADESSGASSPETPSFCYSWSSAGDSHPSIPSYNLPSPTLSGHGSVDVVSYSTPQSDVMAADATRYGGYTSPVCASLPPTPHGGVNDYAYSPTTQYPQYHHPLGAPAPVTGHGFNSGYGLGSATYSYPQLAEQPSYKPWFCDDASSNGTTSSLPSPDSPYALGMCGM